MKLSLVLLLLLGVCACIIVQACEDGPAVPQDTWTVEELIGGQPYTCQRLPCPYCSSKVWRIVTINRRLVMNTVTYTVCAQSRCNCHYPAVSTIHNEVDMCCPTYEWRTVYYSCDTKEEIQLPVDCVCSHVIRPDPTY